MPQLNKTFLGNNPARKAPDSKAVDRDRKGKRTGFIIASVVIILILLAVGLLYYQNNTAPFRRIIITVDDISINMDYFLKRTRLAGKDSMEMLQVLTNERLIKIGAPRYIAEVTPEDINQELRRAASGESETISESEFKEWYRQLLNETKLSDSEYREYVATSLLAARLHEYLTKRVPTVAAQVHLYAILLETNENAEKVRARWEAGEDFADLAQEVSLDEVSGEKGGDLGWFPRGVLVSGFDQVAFSLTIGDVSEPLTYVSDPTSTEIFYYLFMVAEKADAREVSEEFLAVLGDKTFEDWLSEEIGFHKIKYNFDSEIYAWINWQLSKE